MLRSLADRENRDRMKRDSDRKRLVRGKHLGAKDSALIPKTNWKP